MDLPELDFFSTTVLFLSYLNSCLIIFNNLDFLSFL